jgi:hypothetical protein
LSVLSAKRHDVDKVYGDKAYDNRKNFNILDDMNAEPAISIRKNASTRSKGCPLRRDEVFLVKKLGYEGWKQLKDTGSNNTSTIWRRRLYHLCIKSRSKA